MEKFALYTVYVLTLSCFVLAGCTEDIPDPLSHEAVLGMLKDSPQEPLDDPNGLQDTSSTIAFVSGINELQIFLMNPDGTQLRPQVPGTGYAPFWCPSGELAFFSFMDSTIQVIDTYGGELTIVIDNWFGSIADFDPHFSWSSSGKIAFAIMDMDFFSSAIYVMDSDGSNLFRFVTGPEDTYSYYPSWSPDGTKMVFAYEDVNGDSDICVAEFGVKDTIRITFTGEDYQPVWSPDGGKIAFVSDRDSDYDIYVMNTDGSNQINITNNTWDDERPTWSPTGEKIAFQSNRDFDYDIYVMNANGTNEVNITNNPDSADVMPAWSRDTAISIILELFSPPNQDR